MSDDIGRTRPKSRGTDRGSDQGIWPQGCPQRSPPGDRAKRGSAISGRTLGSGIPHRIRAFPRSWGGVMARLSILDRFRPVGAPGPAGLAGVPAADEQGPAAELAPVFAALAADVESCHRLVEEARQEADGALVRAHEQAAAILAPVSYTHLRAHETRHDLVCRLLL